MRKQSNKRGKNPRSTKVQLIPETRIIKDEDGNHVLNPKYGTMRRIYHRNFANY